jgi:hypothetical protein
MMTEAAFVLSLSGLLPLPPAPAAAASTAAGGAAAGSSAAALAGVDGTVVAADGVPIQYHVEGSAGRHGRPALVFAHCCCDRHLWDGAAPAE